MQTAQEIVLEAEKHIQRTETLRELEDLKVQYLGKKGGGVGP